MGNHNGLLTSARRGSTRPGPGLRSPGPCQHRSGDGARAPHRRGRQRHGDGEPRGARGGPGEHARLLDGQGRGLASGGRRQFNWNPPGCSSATCSAAHPSRTPARRCSTASASQTATTAPFSGHAVAALLTRRTSRRPRPSRRPWMPGRRRALPRAPPPLSHPSAAVSPASGPAMSDPRASERRRPPPRGPASWRTVELGVRVGPYDALASGHGRMGAGLSDA